MDNMQYWREQVQCERAIMEAMEDKIDYTVLGFVNGFIVTYINGEFVTK